MSMKATAMKLIQLLEQSFRLRAIARSAFKRVHSSILAFSAFNGINSSIFEHSERYILLCTVKPSMH